MEQAIEQADVVVIGGGQGGIPLAVNLSREGRKTYLFERGALGGSCLNVGCYPSKAFLASAHLAGAARGSAELGVRLTAQVDFPAVMERVRALSGPGDYMRKSLDKAGVVLVNAEASFTGERTVSGGGVTVEAGTVIIDTGNSPAVPPIPGLEGTPYMTYMDFWQLTAQPERIIIIGGGFIGVELGQGMARLGSETHIVDTAGRIIAREEADVSELITEALTDDGVSFHLGVGVSRVEHDGEVFALTLDSGERLEGEALLVAAGQKPNTGRLNAEAAGIELDERGYIRVDSRLQTSADGVYAIGDVTGQPAFTHVSWEDFRRLMSILSGGDRRQGDRVLGYAFLTDPEVGRAGLTREQAEAQGMEVREVTLPLSRVARAYLTGETRGFYRILVDSGDMIVGATLVGPHAGELVHMFIDLMESSVSWRQLEQTVHIHPTLAEGLPTLARRLVKE